MPKTHHAHRKTEKVYTNPATLFAKNDSEDRSATQTVTVNVNLNDQEDCSAGCFKAIVGCFKKSN